MRKKRALKLEEVDTFQYSQLFVFTSTKRFEMEVHFIDFNQFFFNIDACQLVLKGGGEDRGHAGEF